MCPTGCHPRIVASLALPGNANDVRLDGTRAYVAGGTAGLHIVDISSPLSPHLLGSITLPAPGDAYDVRPQGNLVYVADGPAGLLIIDVSSPDHPRIAGSVRPPGIVAHGVDVNGQIAVVAAGFSGIQVFNVANPAPRCSSAAWAARRDEGRGGQREDRVRRRLPRQPSNRRLQHSDGAQARPSLDADRRRQERAI
jgi:Uncharacterized conserved protein